MNWLIASGIVCAGMALCAGAFIHLIGKLGDFIDGIKFR